MEDDPPKAPKPSAFNCFTIFMRSIFVTDQEADEDATAAPSHEDEVNKPEPLFAQLRVKCKNQAASKIEQEFKSFKAVQQECKRLELGAKGKHLVLKEKLILCRANDEYNAEIAVEGGRRP